MTGLHGFKLYHYDPSVAAAILFVILFILTTVLHMYQAISTRTAYIAPLVIGGFFEFVGYIGRIISAQQSPNWVLGPYVVQFLLILLAPALVAATIYMELGRIIQVVDGWKHCYVGKKWLTKIFVAGDVLSFLVQAGGGGIMSRGSTAPSNLTTGSNMIVGGLLIQLVFFGLFIIVAITFDRKIRKQPTALSRDPQIPWY